MNYLIGREFLETHKKFYNQRDLLLRKLHDFLQLKTSSPYNGAAPNGTKFGDSDKRFSSEGKFTGKIQGISHAHLTHNISIVYLIRNGSLYLYGLYTHDDIGTGTPSNKNRQDQMATRWSKTDFDKFDPSKLAPNTQQRAPEVTTKSGPPVSYTPKVKQPTQDQQFDKQTVLPLARKADSVWPQRKLLAKINSAVDKNAVTDIITQEVRNLGSIKISERSLRPFHQDYLSILQSIAQHLFN